jgi:hypothetical protein
VLDQHALEGGAGGAKATDVHLVAGELELVGQRVAGSHRRPELCVQGTQALLGVSGVE